MSLLFFLIAAFLPAFVGRGARRGASTYAALKRPSWTPPGAIIAPVWLVLNVLIGVSAWLVWREHGSAAWPALTLWLLQLMLNSAWAPLFFGAGRLGASVVLVGVLWFVVLATAVGFGWLTPLAGALLAPYLAWLGFVFVLNLGFWRLNRG